MQKIIGVFSICCAGVLFLAPIIAGLYFGSLYRAGGGSAIFISLPGFFLLMNLSFMYRSKSRYLIHSIIYFWITISFMVVSIVYLVPKMDHWPVGVAFIYMLAGLCSSIAGIVFLILHKKSLKK